MKNRKSNEHPIQNEIRDGLVDRAFIFRANVGTAWQGSITKLPGKRMVIDNYRPFSTGLPAGFADLFGFVPVTVTPEMVGQTVALFVAIEVKDKAKASGKQSNFIKAVNDNGGRGGVARSVEDALRIVDGEV